MMGYSTDFTGAFIINKPLDKKTEEQLISLATTRRMKRKLGLKYGAEGEFYFGDNDDNIVDRNQPPGTQPSLWCGWIPSEDGTTLIWDESEKFYHYLEWLGYIIKNFIVPRGYTLNGVVEWAGEESEDVGQIIVKDSIITVMRADLVLVQDKTALVECNNEIKNLIADKVLLDT